MLTQETISKILKYNPDTGYFIRVIDTGGQPAGKIAGWINARGYRKIRLYGKVYPAHKLAWLYMTGDLPTVGIDHINGVFDDNRWCNLRLADQRQNSYNRRMRSDNTSGLKGVSWDPRKGKWVAQCSSKGKNLHLGYYDDKEVASYVRETFAWYEHGEFYIANP